MSTSEERVRADERKRVADYLDAEARRIYARKNTTAFTIAFVLTQRADAIRNGKMKQEEST